MIVSRLCCQLSPVIGVWKNRLTSATTCAMVTIDVRQTLNLYVVPVNLGICISDAVLSYMQPVSQLVDNLPAQPLGYMCPELIFGE